MNNSIYQPDASKLSLDHHLVSSGSSQSWLKECSYENFDGTQMQENESSESEIHVITSYTNLDPKYL